MLHGRNLHLFALLALSLLVCTSCASLHPPVDAPSDAEAVELHPHRADPSGLAIRLHVQGARSGDELQILRHTEEGEWIVAETLSVNQPLADALETGRVEWRDPLPREAASLQYRMRLRHGELTASSPVAVDWRGVPEAPSPRAEPVDTAPPAVRLHWNNPSTHRVHIYRRDVLHDDDYTPLAVVESTSGNTFDDQGLEPAGVYSYRLQFVDRTGPFPRYGNFSESLYVSLPD